ncbi:hypothetical protein OROMI_020672 [Orobanche minor]
MAGGEEFKFFKHRFWSHHNIISDPNPPSQRLLPGEYEHDHTWFFYSMWGRQYNEATTIENFRVDDVVAYWDRVLQPDVSLATSDGDIIGVTRTFRYFMNGSPTTCMMDVSTPHDPLRRFWGIGFYAKSITEVAGRLTLVDPLTKENLAKGGEGV